MCWGVMVNMRLNMFCTPAPAGSDHFKVVGTRNKHEETHSTKSYSCPECVKDFTRKDNLKTHRRKIHGVKNTKEEDQKIEEMIPQLQYPNTHIVGPVAGMVPESDAGHASMDLKLPTLPSLMTGPGPGLDWASNDADFEKYLDSREGRDFSWAGTHTYNYVHCTYVHFLCTLCSPLALALCLSLCSPLALAPCLFLCFCVTQSDFRTIATAMPDLLPSVNAVVLDLEVRHNFVVSARSLYLCLSISVSLPLYLSVSFILCLFL